MSRSIKRKTILPILITFAIVAAFAASSASARSTHTRISSTNTNNNPICGRLGKSLQGSAGLQIYCFGPQPNGPGQSVVKGGAKIKAAFGTNVNAANPNEDRSPSGVQADGQSEVTVASNGNYIVESWNDSTGFFSPCGSPMYKEELLGYGFSSDGGKSFTDQGGLPNNNCFVNRYVSDPSVETWTSGGTTYFYVAGMYDPASFGPGIDPRSHLAVTACAATGSLLSCGQPTIIASSTQCNTQYAFCSFLDKDFITIDPVHGRLYATYTEFGINFFPPDNLTNGQIELAVCDIGTPSGGIGPNGGTASAPTCSNGNAGTYKSTSHPYMVVSPGDLSCESEGAYPAVDPATGDLYAGFEFNWATNIFGSFGGTRDCRGVPTTNVLKYIPFSCLTLPVASCTAPAASNGVNVYSLDATFFPGYNRFPANDFPRLAVSDRAGTVSVVWNDARSHPLGDIFLQSFKLKGLTGVTSSPVQVNSDNAGGMHFLPALRNTDANGNLNISFFQRRAPNTALTNVYAALGVDPLATSTPGSNKLVTTQPTNWLLVSSLIVPNFGDYIDNYVNASTGALSVAWADGRIGIPQPFEASMGT